jgi:hypothetical protein
MSPVVGMTGEHHSLGGGEQVGSLCRCLCGKMLSAQATVMVTLTQVQAERGTRTGLAGTSVATETCGQLRPLKFRKTCCEY